jgi:hypothetical protein
MISGFAKLLLFLSSFLPEFVIFTILYWTKYGYWAVVPTIAGLAGLVGLISVLIWVRSTAPITIDIKSVHRRDEEVVAYLVLYVLPFLSLNLSDPASTISFVILFVTLATVYVTADMIHVNPTLNLLGWHVFEAETSAGSSHTVITRRHRLTPNGKLSVIAIADGIDWEGSVRPPTKSSASC